jgi:hypothetical protein
MANYISVPQPVVEHPNLKTPLALIVDDATPGFNILYFIKQQLENIANPPYARTIPLSFMESWCKLVRETGAKGCFSVLPCPAGLGRIDQSLDGLPKSELRAWLQLAKDHVAPAFDIHPEIMTHTRALDIATKQFLPDDERVWSEAHGVKDLAAYFATAMDILRRAGLPSNGITQPWGFSGDETVYARALCQAESQINQRHVCHNFIHVDWCSPVVPPRITLLDKKKGEAVVSIWTGTDDYLWNAQEAGTAEATMSAGQLADRYITADGEGGRLAQLLPGGGPLVLVTHWQSLYANGTALGVKALEQVTKRLQSLHGNRLQWRKLSEIAQDFLVMRTVSLRTRASKSKMHIALNCPFATDCFTFSVPLPWPLNYAPKISASGAPLQQVEGDTALRAGTWIMRGALITISLALTAGQLKTITVAC